MCLRDLVGQLARRAQHQRLRADLREFDALQQRQAERRGLAAARRGLRDQVVAFEHGRQAARLDRRHAHVAERIETLHQRGVEREIGEFDGVVHAA